MPPLANASTPPLGWTPLARHVELFLTDSGRPLTKENYQGARLLTQHIEPGRDRVPLGGSGGWIATYLHGEPDPEVRGKKRKVMGWGGIESIIKKTNAPPPPFTSSLSSSGHAHRRPRRQRVDGQVPHKIQDGRRHPKRRPGHARRV